MRQILLVASLIAFLTTGAQARKKYTVITNECQTIDGFGASDAWSFWQIGCWDDSLQQQVADWLFSMDTDNQGNPKGIGLSIWRFNAGAGSAEQGDSSYINHDTRTSLYAAQHGQRNFLKLAKKRGVPTFIAFYNTPPVHLTINGLGTNTGRDGTYNLRPDAYDDFAQYAADMIQTADQEDGIHFDYLSPVNEPDGHWNWQGPKQEGTPATNAEVAHIARAMNDEFGKRGITTKILINESSDYRCMLGEYEAGWERGNEIQCFWNPDSTTTYLGNLPLVAPIMAGHSYWTNTPILNPLHTDYEYIGLYGYRKRINEAMQRVGKNFWMTELCIMSNDEEIHGGGGFDFSMEVALYVARVMHYDLTVANACSWQWWRAAGGNYKDGLIRMYTKGERTRRGGAPVRNNFARDSKLMWTMGNFSRFVRPGAVRLNMTGAMLPNDIMMSAYRNTDGTIAIVAINYSNKDCPVCISSTTKNATAYRTSDVEDENLKCIGNVNLKKVNLKARSVTTFVEIP